MREMNPTEENIEAHMKALLLSHLKNRNKINSDDTIINEFTVDNYSRRVDLSIVSQDRFFAFEVKSKKDNLNRLEGQVEKYLQYFDKVIIFTDKKHLEKLTEMVPSNVEIWELHGEKITCKKRGRTKKINSKEKLINLMRADELYKLASNAKKGKPPKTRAKLEIYLADIPTKIVREAAIKALKSRYKITNLLFWQNVSDKVTPVDLKLLSPYRSPLANHRKQNSKHFKSILEDVIEGDTL